MVKKRGAKGGPKLTFKGKSRPSLVSAKAIARLPQGEAPKVGIYTEYLDKRLSFEGVSAERKLQLKRISELRGSRDILVYAADLNPNPLKASLPLALNYSDLLPINDQLTNLSGKAIDLIIETGGGSGETAEDIVKLLRNKYTEVSFIIPGSAKSAGTILAMSGDEILMEPASSLGPIDAQLFWQGQGKAFSADALIAGMNKIKEEVITTGTLNKAYIPILQTISPGELQSAQNALDFGKALVREWLIKYKFKNWTEHTKSGVEVTAEEREQLAIRIADRLADHGYWLTHGRSIKMEDLLGMGLRITDYSQNEELADAIRRYHVLLQMTFGSNIYKLFETPNSQIYRHVAAEVGPPTLPVQNVQSANLTVNCKKCGTKTPLQANFEKNIQLQPGSVPFPLNNKFSCPGCGAAMDLIEPRRQLEAQAGKKLI